MKEQKIALMSDSPILDYYVSVTARGALSEAFQNYYTDWCQHYFNYCSWVTDDWILRIELCPYLSITTPPFLWWPGNFRVVWSLRTRETTLFHVITSLQWSQTNTSVESEGNYRISVLFSLGIHNLHIPIFLPSWQMHFFHLLHNTHLVVYPHLWRYVTR